MEKANVVIVGAGFAGLFAARGLSRSNANVTLVDQHNYHLFQPLLYQVATAGLAPSDIAWPIRSLLRKQKNVTVLLDRVQGVDLARMEISLPERRVPFDYLVLATGARHAYFGHDDWERFAPGLKTIDDATLIRRRVLKAFESAESTDDMVERERLLTFVIVGAGPTGVELAGTIAELARTTLAADFRRIDPRNARVILVEAGPLVLPTFTERSSSYAQKALEKLGVEVRLGNAVTRCDETGVTIAGTTTPSATVLWAAGVAASPAGEWLNAATDGAGRLYVEPDLSIPGYPHVFVIGDAASITDDKGCQVPGIAPAAKQQGRFVARLIRSKIEGRKKTNAFHYRDSGKLATIGRRAAVIEFPHCHLQGFVAWWIWGIAHIYFLIGVRSPVIVALQWLWQYLSHSRGARLITNARFEKDAD